MSSKMIPTGASVEAFLQAVGNPGRREDGLWLCALIERVTGAEATMWGESIVGFGSCHYQYDSGREGDMPQVGFSPRGANLVLYVGGFAEYPELLGRLGKHKTSKACLYLGRLNTVDEAVLEEIIRKSFTAGGSC